MNLFKSVSPDRNSARPLPKILIIDDQISIITLIQSIFSDGYNTFSTNNSTQAIEMCAKFQPDLVLLDVNMPKISGLELCETLHYNPQTAAIPVIFVTGQLDPASENACWKAGAVDFVNKPFNTLTLKNRVNVHLTLKFQADHLRSMAFIDGLTGIPNRRYFEMRLDQEYRRCARSGAPLSLLMIDLDYFKLYNDHYGHQAGDEVLCKVAHTLKSTLGRPGDMAARYGGEEFVCLLPETNLAGERTVGEKLVKAIREISLEHVKSDAAKIVTISVGAASSIPEQGISAKRLILAADRQLYRAKNDGRNRICVDDSSDTPDH